jgi:hypothetical protein
MLDGKATDALEASSLGFGYQYVDIYSNCWGPKDDGKTFGKPGPLAAKSLKLGAEKVGYSWCLFVSTLNMYVSTAFMDSAAFCNRSSCITGLTGLSRLTSFSVILQCARLHNWFDRFNWLDFFLSHFIMD